MMPGLYNPQRGFIVTANNPVAAPGYEYLIGTEFANGYRAQRIEERLAELEDGISIEDLKSVHADVYTLHGEEFLSRVIDTDARQAVEAYLGHADWLTSQQKALSADRMEAGKEVPAGGGAPGGKTPGEHPEDYKRLIQLVEDVLNLWRDWDYRMNAGSPQALAYAFVWRELILNTMEDEFPAAGQVRGSISDYESFFHTLLADPDHLMWDYRPSAPKERMEDIVSRSVAEGLKKAAQLHGWDPAKWQWGDAHLVEFRNATLGESGIPLVESLFNRGPYPVPGHGSTVNVTHWALNGSFRVHSIASQRSILDAGNPDNSLFIHPGGQSGHPFHRHYDDYIHEWVNVEYHPGRFSRKAVEADSAGRRIRLLPQ